METVQQNGRFTLQVNSPLIYILFSLLISYQEKVRTKSSNLQKKLFSCIMGLCKRLDYDFQITN